tara:strand:+ start:122 stop:1042 length:921 start_codon:yes stop_codon:yes gene_type:complete
MKLLSKIRKFFRLSLLLVLIPSLLFAEELGDTKTLINKASSAVTDSISNTFGNLTSFNGIKKADLEIETKSQNFQSDVRATIISSLSENEEMGTYWLNQTNFSDHNDRQTFNTGFMYRNLSSDKKWVRGFNLFYDHEFPKNHQRASVGLEIKSSAIELNSNYYQSLSGDKTVGTNTERAMDGVDAEIGFQVPYMPSSKLFFQGYEWDGVDYDVKSGNKISLRVRPTTSLEIEIGAEDNDRQSDYQGTAKITFTKALGNVPERNSGLYISDQMFEYQDMSGEIYEKVRRQNRIVKTVTGTVTVARGT